MTQRRHFDRGSLYSFEALRDLHRYTFSPGVYYGMNLSPSATSGSEVNISAGALALASGVVVVETTSVIVSIGSTFPPALATDYTIACRHDEAYVGMTGGEAATYYATDSLLTTQPSDGTIVGWIRHPGGGVALAVSHIVNAPKLNPWTLGQTFAAREPHRLVPPNLAMTDEGADVTLTDGYDSTNVVVWRGPTNAVAVGSQAANLWYQFPVDAQPYEVKLRSIIPGGSIVIRVYDTANASAVTKTVVANPGWTWDTLTVPVTGNTWTLGGRGLVKLECTIPAGNSFQFAELEVNFWPYGLSRT